jgi:hypothetical protein
LNDESYPFNGGIIEASEESQCCRTNALNAHDDDVSSSSTEHRMSAHPYVSYRRGAEPPVIRCAICRSFCCVLGFLASLRPRSISLRPCGLFKNPLIRWATDVMAYPFRCSPACDRLPPRVASSLGHLPPPDGGFGRSARWPPLVAVPGHAACRTGYAPVPPLTPHGRRRRGETR